MLISGCSGGEGVTLNPPQSPSPPPATPPPPPPRLRHLRRPPAPAAGAPAGASARASASAAAGASAGTAARAAAAATAAAAEPQWTRRAAQQHDLHRARARHGQRHHRHAAGVSEPHVPESTHLPAAGAGRCEPLVRGGAVRRRARVRQQRGRDDYLGFHQHRPARRVNVRRMRPARHGVSPRFPRDPARVSVLHQPGAPLADGPDSRLSEFTSRDGGLTLDPDSERIILTISKETVHHHGGRIAFGPDGFLYLGMGDGNSCRSTTARA